MARMSRAREIAWHEAVMLPAHQNKGSAGEIMLLKAIKAFGVGLPLPKREVEFAKSIGKRYRADMAYVDGTKLLIEVDGGQWMKRQNADGGQMVGGSHSRDTDRWRNNAAAMLGYRVLHFSPEMIRDHPERVVNEIRQALACSVRESMF